MKIRAGSRHSSLRCENTADASRASMVKVSPTATASADEVPSTETRAVLRRDSAYGGNLFTHAVDLLVQITGAGGLYSRNPMQRYFRDVHALAQHAAMVWDMCGQNYGQIALGGEPAQPMV